MYNCRRTREDPRPCVVWRVRGLSMWHVLLAEVLTQPRTAASSVFAPSTLTPCRVPGTNKVTWGQSRTLLPVGHPGRVKPDGSLERRPPPKHRTNESMQELAREHEALLRQGDVRAAADHYREHGQQICPFHRLPYAWLTVTDGMHAVTSPARPTLATRQSRHFGIAGGQLHGRNGAALQG